LPQQGALIYNRKKRLARPAWDLGVPINTPSPRPTHGCTHGLRCDDGKLRGQRAAGIYHGLGWRLYVDDESFLVILRPLAFYVLCSSRSPPNLQQLLLPVCSCSGCCVGSTSNSSDGGSSPSFSAQSGFYAPQSLASSTLSA
jgi:hypothetical protein